MAERGLVGTMANEQAKMPRQGGSLLLFLDMVLTITSIDSSDLGNRLNPDLDYDNLFLMISYLTPGR
ncbi:hypothetical protein FHU10_2557 [Serratia fonticola]|uniref:Uncharacterized protein n=1 Tax=Serratia fonticola TaxID=47917 RepID=A0A542BV76_SERFO|nr:hypothetical protein FHU09_5152 [Serratia fonticola]TQI95516.1 hypothetical protein FHU11_0898 [Serratia fonticola]TVZ70011.1 hypothetical protein FHU10_2557 [Serratia fonticola]